MVKLFSGMDTLVATPGIVLFLIITVVCISEASRRRGKKGLKKSPRDMRKAKHEPHREEGRGESLRCDPRPGSFTTTINNTDD